jgi:hypothetical protein
MTPAEKLSQVANRGRQPEGGILQQIFASAKSL